jgi:hypothetical protein
MGASTGRISWKPIGGGLFDAGGTRIIDAVRFQDAGYPGELFVDESTFKGLLPEQQARFETQSLEVKGKREESYTIRRCVFDNQAAMEAEKYGLWKRKTGSRRGWKIAIKDLLRYLKR